MTSIGVNISTSKATKTLGFLLRNMAFAPRETKAAAYKTLTRPKLEYATPVWMPHHQKKKKKKKKIDRIEKCSENCCSLAQSTPRWRNVSRAPMANSAGKTTASFSDSTH